jgi:hypothetical protein
MQLAEIGDFDPLSDWEHIERCSDLTYTFYQVAP